MDNKDILTINHRFYELYAEEFSATRKSKWPGWDGTLEYISKLTSPKILDVACGNGRFYNFLKQNVVGSFEYLGLDFSSRLISEARKTYGAQLFGVANIENITKKYFGQYDVVVAFGITHHVGEDLGVFIDKLRQCLKPSGILIVSFWVHTPEIKNVKEDLGNGDYLLNWGGDNIKFRFVHIFTPAEAKKLIVDAGMNILKTYFADGKTKKANLYLICQKE